MQLALFATANEEAEFYANNRLDESRENFLFKDNPEFKDFERLALRFKAYAEYPAEKLMATVQKSDKILEIGSGYGWLIEYMRGKGYSMDGVEIDDKKREHFHSRTGSELFSFNFMFDSSATNNYADLPKYDVLAMFHTLEHISEPVLFIQRAMQLLKPGGKVYVEVPNLNDFLKDIVDVYDNFHFQAVHLQYFAPDTLKRCLELAGCSDVSITGNHYYTIENAIHWIKEKAPFIPYHQISIPEQLKRADESYKRKIENELGSYAIIAVGTKQKLIKKGI